MKSFLCTLLFSIFVLAGYAASIPSDTLKIADPGLDKENCTFNGKPLYGRVKIVEYAADFNVKIVEYSADLDVKIVESSSNRCGEWNFVEYAPDFTIRIVEYSPDFEIRFVESASGIR